MTQDHSSMQNYLVMSQDFNHLLDRYQHLIQKLERTQPSLTEVEVSEVLTHRDRVQESMADRYSLSPEQLIFLTDLDHDLKRQEGVVTNHLDLSSWRRLINPPETAWWWYLTTPEPKRWWNEFDWLFNAGTLMALTICASLIADTTTRLFSGGIDLGATLVISGQSLLALLAGGGALTQAGHEVYRRILERLSINKRYWQEASFLFALVLTLMLAGVHLNLPQLAESAKNRGEASFEVGKLKSARKSFQQAIALKPNYVEAHFNLARVYENLQQIDKAKEEYQLVVTQKLEGCQLTQAEDCDLLLWLQAHNNLARLDILDQNYNVAAPLLQAGLRKLRQKPVEANAETKRLQYDLFKNLGWARLNQAFFKEAESLLKDAVQVDPQTPDAFCLLAKLFEAQKDQTKELEAWKKCSTLAHQNPIVLETQPEVNEWAAMANEKLAQARKEV